MASIAQCSITNCSRNGRISSDGKRYFLKGFCNMHYKRNKKGTDMHAPVKYSHIGRYATFRNGIAIIPIGVGSKDGHALVDKHMAWLDKYKWVLSNGYASTYIKGKNVQMHRLIMSAGKDTYIDHIDRNRLNNQLSNLRLATSAQNRWNSPPRIGTSVFKGIHQKENGTWRARITHNGDSIELGVFSDEIEAAKSYDKAAKEYFGEYAYLNFP